MAENTKINWATHTFNPWIGCTKVSAGCKFCYAKEMMEDRYGRAKWGAGNPRSRTSEANWKTPIRWDRKAEKEGTRSRVFCSSLADVFDAEVDQEWRDDLWKLIGKTPNLDWLILTKRPEEIEFMVPQKWLTGLWPENVWLGVSVENQEAACARVPVLLKFPAPVRFLSCEPLVGPVDLGTGMAGIDWVIVGGESGKDARPMHPEWAKQLRSQCKSREIPFLFKQWGEFRPAVRQDPPSCQCSLIGFSGREKGLNEAFCPPLDAMMSRVGKKKTGRLLDGELYDEFPFPLFRDEMSK